MTTPREAILETADLFERKPEVFDFYSIRAPDGCGTPGCALGWIGVYLNVPTYEDDPRTFDGGLSSIGVKLGADDSSDFYARMKELCGSYDWQYDAKVCAKVLRAYADKYFPEVSGELPESVRRIFEPERVKAWEGMG